MVLSTRSDNKLDLLNICKTTESFCLTLKRSTWYTRKTFIVYFPVKDNSKDYLFCKVGIYVVPNSTSDDGIMRFFSYIHVYTQFDGSPFFFSEILTFPVKEGRNLRRVKFRLR